MRADRDQRIKEIFARAGELPGAERKRFLDIECMDEGIRAAVERLLLADEAAASKFLDGSAGPAPVPQAPARVGRFRLIRKIGEGGMGTVYEAEQDHPRRKVALKMVRYAGLPDAMLRRFEYEVQILGQLRHPGIAQIHEAGTHDDGSGAVPYFAMEFVHGRPLVAFARHKNLSTRQRLELMADICDAVHHAHQKGVIHRDLKPANVLVEESGDGRNQPKILDFGVACASSADVAFATMHTQAGQLVGTLSYMSPEQIAGRPDDLDVRSDVYALGVMLYELLTERLPYDLRNRSLAEIGTMIREQDPTRLGSIDTHFRGDIDTIVVKALAKEKERRYASAAELAEDIRRYLRDEPIIARPASKAYTLRKFARRHKGLVGGVATAFAALLVAVIGISVALVRATRAERVAIERLDESRRATAKATAVSKFLQNMLAGVDPEDIGPRGLTVREVLDHASDRLERELGDQPEIAAPIHQTLGNHYSTLGLYFEADLHLRKAVELRRTLARGDDPELADALSDLAANMQEKRDIEDAEGPTREALEMRRRLFGPSSLEVAASLYDLASILIEQLRASEAEPFARESLDIRRRLLGDEHESVATSIGILGWCHMVLGQLNEAESRSREAVDMVRRLAGDNELALASRLTFLSVVLRAAGKIAEEEAVLREAIEIRTRRLAQDHPALAWNLFCLAQARRKQGDFVESETKGRRALEIYLIRRGPVHTDVADCHELLAQIHDDQGRFVEAEAWWKSCLEMRRKLLPADHSEIALAEEALARNKAAQKKVSAPLGSAGGR